MGRNFTTTDVAGQQHGVKLLLYGRSGVGKTWLVRTVPAPFLISAESGVLSLRDCSIPMAKISTVEDLTDLYNWITSDKQAKQFQTIYIDSISEIGEVVLTNAKKVAKDPRQAYGELIDKTLMVIKAFRDLPNYHVVMVAKQEPHKDEITGVTTYGPSMPGSKLASQLPYLFDEVLRLGVQNNPKGGTYRFIQTQPDFQHEAKDRSGALDPVEAPDLGAIFNKILARK